MEHCAEADFLKRTKIEFILAVYISPITFVKSKAFLFWYEGCDYETGDLITFVKGKEFLYEVATMRRETNNICKE